MSGRKINDYCKMFYHSLHLILEGSKNENPRISYVTAIGIVEGELAQINKIVFTGEKKELNVRELAIELLNKNEDDQDLFENRDSLLHLKNVKVYPINGSISVYNFGELTLNIHQIIGVAAGTKE